MRPTSALAWVVVMRPAQLWLGLHDVKMEVHRKLGVVYIAAMAVGSFGAIGLALQTAGGLVRSGNISSSSTASGRSGATS